MEKEGFCRNGAEVGARLVRDALQGMMTSATKTNAAGRVARSASL